MTDSSNAPPNMFFLGRTDVDHGTGAQMSYGAFATADEAADFAHRLGVAGCTLVVFEGIPRIEIVKPAAQALTRTFGE